MLQSCQKSLNKLRNFFRYQARGGIRKVLTSPLLQEHDDEPAHFRYVAQQRFLTL